MSSGFENPGMSSFLTGVNIALNAISDAFLVVDGPPCTFFRMAQVKGNHDWYSTLSSSSGFHRVMNTDCITERAAQGDESKLIENVGRVAELEECGLIVLSAMSMIAVTGRQYEKILKKLREKIDKPIIYVKPGSMAGDWLSGYSTVLESLAEQVPIRKRPKLRKNSVAIVGYLMDRLEADHQANLEEIKRLLAGLSLDRGVCWLDGSDSTNLSKISEVGTIVSLPYGRRAAEILAKRTGANLVECGLPIGLDGTNRWLRQIGAGTGREIEAEALIERELADVVPRLRWVLPHSLFDKGIALIGDPHLVSALTTASIELGARVELAVIWAQADDDFEMAEGDHPLLVFPDLDQLHREFTRLQKAHKLDLLVTNSQALTMLIHLEVAAIPFIELGFASYHTHSLYDCPYFGYRGTLKLVERMTNAISQAAVFQNSR
jgi:nitrogenase molybdenum-iron protein alpha/beta subunit